MSIRDTAKARTTLDPDGYPILGPKPTKKQRIADLMAENHLLRSQAGESRIIILRTQPGKPAEVWLDKVARDFTINLDNDVMDVGSMTEPVVVPIVIGGQITIRWR